MKMQSLAFALVISASGISAVSFAAGSDKQNSKLKIAHVSRPDEDCKISITEINNLSGNDAGRRYICTGIDGDASETTLAEVAEMIKLKDLAFSYEGSSSESLVELFARWKAFLIEDFEGTDALDEIIPYEVSLVREDRETVTLKLQNKDSGDAVEFSIRMNDRTIREKN